MIKVTDIEWDVECQFLIGNVFHADLQFQKVPIVVDSVNSS